MRCSRRRPLSLLCAFATFTLLVTRPSLLSFPQSCFVSLGVPLVFPGCSQRSRLQRWSAGGKTSTGSQAASAWSDGVPPEWTEIAEAQQDPEQWEEDGIILGQGAFGIVRRGVNKETGELVAIKRIAPTHPMAIETARSEIEAARAVGEHPNIVQLKAYFLTPAANNDQGKRRDMVLVYRLALGGDLQDWIRRQHGSSFDAVDYAQPMLNDESLRIMLQLTVGLQHLHDKGVQHRDLKPANLLLSAGATALIGDLGIALVNHSNVPRTHAAVGDFYFMDVDALVKKKLPYVLDDDVYALGEVFVRILYGNYATASELKRFVNAHDDPPVITRVIAAMTEPRERRRSLVDVHNLLLNLGFQPLPSEPRPIVTAGFLGIGAIVTAATVAARMRTVSLRRPLSVFSRRSRLQAGFCVGRSQGRPNYMEDYYCHSRVSFKTSPMARTWRLLGIFDGHGGKDVAKFAARFLPHEVQRFFSEFEGRHKDREALEADDLRTAAEALQLALESLDDCFIKYKRKGFSSTRGFGYPGSTGAAALVTPDGLNAVLCTVGDSRVGLVGDWKVMKQGGAAPEVSDDGTVVLMHPHSPADPAEISRIEEAGGFVEVTGRGHRVNGVLGVARAIGYKDVRLFSNVVVSKSDYIIAERPRGGKGSALVALATDGVLEGLNAGCPEGVFARLAAARNALELSENIQAELDRAGGGPNKAHHNPDNAALLACLLPPTLL